MSSKETIRQLQQLFADPKASTSSAAPSFPDLSVTPSINSLLDTHLASFAASFSDSSSASALSDRERERTLWRDGLLRIWGVVEPTPGSEGDQLAIERVSAFLVLLQKVSADVQDDEDSALVTRSDIGKVWWRTLLRRTILGTPKEPTEGEKEKAKGKRPAKPEGAASSTDTARPLTVSREAIGAARRIIVWGMSSAIAVLDQDETHVTPFCLDVCAEFETRSVATLRGGDDWYGLRNVAECMMAWAERQTRAFFAQIARAIALDAPSQVLFLSLLTSFLARHPGKAHHGHKTPLLANLVNSCLTSPSPAVVILGSKSLIIFLAALPVIIGEDLLLGVFAVYGRAVSWETREDLEDAVDQAFKDKPTSEEAFAISSPDPMELFTILYGIYPCNFVAFLKDTEGYLKGKEWKGGRGDGVLRLDSAVVRDRSKHLIRRHRLHPSLLTGDSAAELTDTNRWDGIETASVRAECDRNVVPEFFDEARDFRGGEKLDMDDATEVHEAESFLGRSRTRDLRPGEGTLALELERMFSRRSVQGSVDVEDEDGDTTNQRARTPVPRTASTSRSRSPTPHMPATTHYTNFQALQSQSASPHSSMSPGRSISRFREPDPLSWSANFSSADSSALPSSNNSRAASIINSAAPAPLSPFASSLVQSSAPDGGLSRSNSKATHVPTNAQIAKLETEIILLHGEVAFQTYLKQLHVAHMGTLHREKVLQSGAEAERQSLHRTARVLKEQLKQTKAALDQLRSESGVTKANWIAHIEELKGKLKLMREAKLKWEHDGQLLRAELEESKEKEEKAKKELETQGAAYFELQNQVALDAQKLEKIAEYEARIKALTKTLAICDEDLARFREQRRDMDLLVAEWKRSELLREATEAELVMVKEQLRVNIESEPSSVLREALSKPSVTLTTTTKGDWQKMNEEVERLRKRNRTLEKKVIELSE